MKKVLQALLRGPIFGAMILMGSNTAMAMETFVDVEDEEMTASTTSTDKIEDKAQQNLIAQVTSVSQLSDVQLTDWAFQALQSLVERYGCIAGYPNQTYRGNRALTRYEFAAGLNACLDRVNELIATAADSGVTQEDLAVLQKLQEEFEGELARLRSRVDALEARSARIEQNQFSTTSKLNGEVVTAVTDVWGGDTDEGNTTLGARAIISLKSMIILLLLLELFG